MSDTSTQPAAEPSWDECMALLEGLPRLPLSERAEVLERLVRNPSPAIRDRALRVGAAVLPDETLVDYLRHGDDAVLRNVGIEILKDRGNRSYKLAVDLLRDEDPDVVLQAVLILDHVKDPRAVEALRATLGHDDPNVDQAAIVAMGHLGDSRVVPDLLPFLNGDTWLKVAAVQALGDLRSPAAVAPLTELLTDLMIGPMAAEALAQIGGAEAFSALAEHWLRYHEEVELESSLGLLAHVLEGLPGPPRPVEGLRPRLSERLRDPFREVRVGAARCVLAMGAGSEDSEALNILAGAYREAKLLPSCLTHRQDLAPALLEKGGLPRQWGYLLASRHRSAVSVENLARALESETEPEDLTPAVQAMVAAASAELAVPLLRLYQRLPAERRPALQPALTANRSAVLAAVAADDEIAGDERLVLGALLGETPEVICRGIEELPTQARLRTLGQLLDHREIVARLPWSDWLDREPDLYTDLAGRAAAQAELRDLVPVLRRALGRSPTAAAIRAVGELKDRESVPLLLGVLATGADRIKPLVVESLGKIGGPQARAALRELAGSADEMVSRLAYKSLGGCAIEEDEALFRDAITHPDWFVRLACVEVLGRFARPENLAALSQLAADPVAVVAQSAKAGLEA